MAKKVFPKISLSFSKEQLSDFLLKIKELSKIDDKIVFKLTNNNLLLYSTITKGKQIYAFKSFIFETKSIMSLHDELISEVTLIIKDSKKFVLNLANYLEFDFEVDVELSYGEINGQIFSDMIKFSNGKLKISLAAGDPVNINTSITIENISKFSDVKNALFNFELNAETYARIKKMGTINSQAKKTTTPSDIDPLILSVSDKKLLIGENKWSLDIGEIDREDESFSFPKKYFNTMNIPDKATIYVFDSFILSKTESSELLITMETTV